MKLVKMQCPSCGANLSNDIPEETTYIFCLYCGQKMLIEDGVERSEHRYVKEDVAELKRIESEKEIELKRLEMMEKDDVRTNRLLKGILIGCLIMIVGGIVALYVDEAVRNHHINQMVQQGKISAGSHQDYEGKDVHAVESQLRDLGFTNIKTYDLNDAGLLWDKADTVASIKIDGKESFFKSDYFDQNVTISITYH